MIAFAQTGRGTDGARPEFRRVVPATGRSVPRWLETLFRIPLEAKILGANLIIMIVALSMLFGPIRLEPTRFIDAVIVLVALGVGAIVNFFLVRLSLRPIKVLTRFAWLVSEGVRGERVPRSIIADSELTQLSTTINRLLDDLVTEQVQINSLNAELAKAGVRNGRLRGIDSRRFVGARR
jgi:HAMP domain-containing protein